MNIISKSFFNSLFKLHTNCKSFSSRNILEVLAVIENIKNVVRIPIKNNEWKYLKEFCKKNKLSICHSNFKISVIRRTSLGDVFTENVTWESKSSSIIGFVAYIALTEELAQKASTLESSADSFQLGKLYQYPKCCVKSYSKHIEEGKYWLDLLLKNSKGYNHSLFSNKIAYLIDETSIIPDYFPCSLNCRDTISIGKDYKNMLIKNKLDSHYDLIKNKLIRPIIIGDGVLFQLKKQSPIVKLKDCNTFIWKNKNYNNLEMKKIDFLDVDQDNHKVYLNDNFFGRLYQFKEYL